ncbi:Ras-related protein Rab-37 [Tritrichomonas foetus]|uniref:Ras-related protein Rab-37 n=1 Tax=Tritrichomonas foetus TaxID=1144522 RepID=A0A1J4K2G8_9EUKA|nr:Ras-related protein Rab-37 [Tritrichomonas foetus]|eukprot:OHT05395.1 Ras-related protein Rab-37 [Tritrichomonas foetus]
MLPESELLHDIKITFLGISNVGKTSIIKQFHDNTFEDSFVPTIGVEFLNHTMSIDGNRFCVKLLDTAGQEKYRSLSGVYLRDSDGCVFVFDLTNSNSFKELPFYFTIYQENLYELPPVLLLGNKSDLSENMITDKEINQMMTKYHISNYFEVSALTGTNIRESIECLIRDIVIHNRKKTEKNSVSIIDYGDKKQKSCC